VLSEVVVEEVVMEQLRSVVLVSWVGRSRRMIWESIHHQASG
jgi:hypothetical protein